MQQAASPSRADSSVKIQDLTARVKHEYRELPGLILTRPQAQRLFGLDSVTFDAVFGALVDAGILQCRSQGTYARRTGPIVDAGA